MTIQDKSNSPEIRSFSSLVDELFKCAEVKNASWKDENLGLGQSTII